MVNITKENQLLIRMPERYSTENSNFFEQNELHILMRLKLLNVNISNLRSNAFNHLVRRISFSRIFPIVNNSNYNLFAQQRNKLRLGVLSCGIFWSMNLHGRRNPTPLTIGLRLLFCSWKS